MFQCVTVAKVKEECVPDIKAAGEKLSIVAHGEKGNLSYNILKSTREPDALVFVESWETFEDFLEHVKNAKIPGTALNEFGSVMDVAQVEEAKVYPCEVLV